MALDIPALARGGWAKAKSVAGSAFATGVLRIGNTPVIDPVADTSTPSWAFEVTLTKSILFYGRKLQDEQDQAEDVRGATARITEAKAIVGVADLPAGAVPDNDSELEINGEKWEVANVGTPPGNAIYLLDLRKK